MQLNFILVAHTLLLLENELGSVVCDDSFGDAESWNDIGLDKLNHCGSFDFGEGFSFGPFCVIFSYSQDERFSLWSCGSCFR